MREIKCKKCGALNNSNNILCSNCGEILTNSVKGKLYAENKHRDKRFVRRKWIVLLVLLLLLMCVGGIGVYYLQMTNRIQGIWSSTYGDIMLETTGTARTFKASFVEGETFEWKFCVWSNTLELKNVEEDSKDIFYKVKFSKDGQTMELTQNGTNNQYTFCKKSMLVYGI